MTTTVIRLRGEYQWDNAVVATPQPRLSWKTVSDSDNWMQVRAEIRLNRTALSFVEGPDSVFVDWPFDDLTSAERCTVEVRVWGNDGSMSDWSEPLQIRAGFLPENGWRAQMLRLGQPVRPAQPFRVRQDFSVEKAVKQAILYATADGVFQASINGTAVDDHLMKPGWTPYTLRTTHTATDVTHLVQAGANAIGLEVAGAWYTEKYGFGPTAKPFYGEQPGVSAQLLLEYTDGSVQWVVTDSSWRIDGNGPLVTSSLYDGEEWDFRQDQPGWDCYGFALPWETPAVADVSVVPSLSFSPPVREVEEIPVQSIFKSSSGKTLIDFGQNLVGYVRARLAGPVGTTVTVKYAEVLDEGELGIRPLRYAKVTDQITLNGQPITWNPRFTFHGFRYVQIDGPFDPDSLKAIVVHSDMERTGTFESSNPLLNRLHENVVWGMRGNFLSVPTDCPQRDERLGWTGDIQVFAPTACFLYDANAFLSSWLIDLGLEQRDADRVVPPVVPNVLKGFFGDEASVPAAAWGDAATVVPTVLNSQYADIKTLGRQYDSMKNWTDLIVERSGDNLLWDSGFQYGDWLDPTAPPEDAARAATSSDIVATAYVIRSCDLTAQAAARLGIDKDCAHYEELAARVRMAFIDAFVGADGIMTSDAQTAYALALAFDIVSDSAIRQQMASRLASLVANNGYRIGTGFVGTPIVCRALSENGQVEAAAQLLLATATPSWLWPVTAGATTIWERWDSLLPDGSINPGEMTSFNHYALGAVAEWLHQSVAGLSAIEEGYRVMRIAPTPLAGLMQASATLDTPYGKAAVTWRRSGETLLIQAEVPANTEAVVELPGQADTLRVGSGSHSWAASL